MFAPEIKEYFGIWVSRNEMRGALLDLDDCLLMVSRDTFDWGFGRYFSTILAQVPNIDIGQLRANWRLANKVKYEQVGVDRTRWDVAVDALAGMYPEIGREIFYTGYQELDTKMYQRVPGWCSGAREAVELFRDSGLKIAIVTHGDEKWTELKTGVNGVRDRVDAIITANPRDHRSKTKAHWQQGLIELSIGPDSVMGAGDNKKTDIGELYALGISHLAYVRSIWALYAQGDLPPDVPTVKNLGRWIEWLAVCESRRNGVRLGK